MIDNTEVAIQHLSRELYPNLSAAEAYLTFHREHVAPLVGPVINGTLKALEIAALLADPTSWVSKVVGIRLLKDSGVEIYDYIKSLAATPQSTLGNLTGATEKEISAQLEAEIWRRLKAGTPGFPNSFTDGTGLAAAGESSGLPTGGVKGVPKDIRVKSTPAASANASSAQAESLLDRINYLECWNTALRTIQTAQAQQIIKALNVIADHLGDTNCIAVMGAGGPDGFARPIYDLIKMKINKVHAADRKNHRFFIYHDSNNWHGPFERLTSENPLPSEFVNNPCDDLNHACLFMREVRQKLIAKDEKRGKAMIFHLLIPSWSKLQIKEPLHFPEDLYPLQIEGLKHKGKDQVELNLPAAPAGLLHGVSNVLDANNWNTIARGTSVAVTGPTVGWGINGACLALGVGVGTVTGLGVLLAVPIWWTAASYTMVPAAEAIDNTIYDALCEEDPRVLGSKERFHVPRWHR